MPQPTATIRSMLPGDYDEVFSLWKHTGGFALRAIDDSKEAIQRFLIRNPNTSMVAIADGNIVGSILCGHDGRQGSFYHVCVAKDFRQHGIGHMMVEASLDALAKEGISKAALVAFSSNKGGNLFWESIGWTPRTDLNCYEFVLNKENTINVVEPDE